MTNEQKTLCHQLHAEGLGYTRIAAKLGISVNTIKSFCQRNAKLALQTSGKRTPANPKPPIPAFCKNCGKPLKQLRGRKPKQFCTDQCRMAWWNSNLDQVNRKAYRKCTCDACGKVFEAYGCRPRKYCCHACYIQKRFGGYTNG